MEVVAVPVPEAADALVTVPPVQFDQQTEVVVPDIAEKSKARSRALPVSARQIDSRPVAAGSREPRNVDARRKDAGLGGRSTAACRHLWMPELASQPVDKMARRS